MFYSIVKVLIFQYHTMLSSLRSSLWAYHTDATTHSIPHAMLSSLLPVGVPHRRPLHPQSVNTIASTSLESMGVDTDSWHSNSWDHEKHGRRRPPHDAFIAPPGGRIASTPSSPSEFHSSSGGTEGRCGIRALYRRPAPSHRTCGV